MSIFTSASSLVIYRFRLSRSFRRSLRLCLTSKRQASASSLKDKGGMLVCVPVYMQRVGYGSGG